MNDLDKAFYSYLVFLVVMFGIVLYSSHAESKELLVTAWSHHNDDSGTDYNENHHMVGVVLDNGYGVATFKNSIDRQSVLVGKWYNWRDWSRGPLKVSLGGTMGLVTGYNDYVGPFAMPRLSLSMGLLHLDTHISPLLGGYVIMHNIRMTFD